MLLLFCLSSLLVASCVQATVPGSKFDDLIDIKDQRKYSTKDFWKVIFATYYDMKGWRNETTDKIAEDFFEHEFKAYPDELYPTFKKIFEHISKSNDRIWNFYESIIYLYNNVDAADRIYETVLRRYALGNLLKESGKLDTDVPFPIDEKPEVNYANLKHRSGVIIDEEELPVEPLQVGSIRAVPGVHFPNYDDIPISSFTCAGKHIPGFYADLETGCQVFHVCYPHRRESFLCPVGTTFNQAILACDYWYSSNCSLAPQYFDSNVIAENEHFEAGEESFVDQLLGQYDQSIISPTTLRPVDSSFGKPMNLKSPKIKISLPNIDWTLMIKFLPIKSKIIECPDFCEEVPHPTEPTVGLSPIITEYAETTTAKPITAPPVTESHKKDKYDRKTAKPPTPTFTEYARTTTTKPSTFPPATESHKYDEKTAKPEILLDILKAVKVLTKDAENFLTEMVQKKRDHNIVPSGIGKSFKFPKPSKLAPAPQLATKKPKHFPEINPRFVVKPVQPAQNLQQPKVSRSKLLKPSKSLKVKRQHVIRNKEPTKLTLAGIKAIKHLFD